MQTKVIKEEVGQYFENNHFRTHLYSKKNCTLVIKLFLEQKSAKLSIINLVFNTRFNEKNAIESVYKIGISVLPVQCFRAMLQTKKFNIQYLYYGLYQRSYKGAAQF